MAGTFSATNALDSELLLEVGAKPPGTCHPTSYPVVHLNAKAGV